MIVRCDVSYDRCKQLQGSQPGSRKGKEVRRPSRKKFCLGSIITATNGFTLPYIITTTFETSKTGELERVESSGTNTRTLAYTRQVVSGSSELYVTAWYSVTPFHFTVKMH